MSHLLLIEPNTLLAGTYTQLFQSAGWQVTHVTGAQAGISAADQQAPDAVVLELQLPQHSGLEFLHEFRSYAEWQHVPVIVHSLLPPAQLNFAAEPLRQQLGVRHLLYKPQTSLQTLLNTVHEAVA